MSLLLFGTGAEAMAISWVAGDISTSDNVTTVTGVNWPSHPAGSLALLPWALINTATPTLDSDFTELDNDVDQNLRAILGQRLPADMTGSESGAISMTVDGASTNRMAAVLGIWSGVDSIGAIVNFTEGGTADDVHPVANNLSITPEADNSLIVLVYAERSSTGNTAGTLAAPTGPGGGSATIRVERGTGNSGGTYVQLAEFQLGAGTAGNAQAFTQWNATPDTLIASNVEMWLIELKELSTAVDLVVDAAAQAHAADSPALTQVHNLAAEASTQLQAADAPTLTQVHVLTVQDATHAQASETPSLQVVLGVQDAVHAQTADSPTLIQQHTLVVDGAAQSQVADSPTLSQTHILTVAAASQAQTVDSPALVQVHNLTVQDAVHAQVADEPAVNSATSLVVDEASQLQEAASPVLVQDHVLAVDAADQQQAATAPTLTQLHVFAADSALQEITSDSPALTQVHTLVVQDAAQEQTADEASVDLVAAITLRPFTGVTSRPLTGVTARPDTGITVRP